MTRTSDSRLCTFHYIPTLLRLEPRQFKNNLTMFESKLILKLAPFPLTYTVREKRRQFQNELTLKHSEVILALSWL